MWLRSTYVNTDAVDKIKDIYLQHLPTGNPFSLQLSLSSVLRMSFSRTLYSMHDKAFNSPFAADSTTAQRISRPSTYLPKKIRRNKVINR